MNPENVQPPSRIVKLLGNIYLSYSAAVLPIAGFFLINIFHVISMNMVTFVICVATIGIVSASIASYTKLPTTPWKMAIFLLDAPFWAILSNHTWQSMSLTITKTALIESLTILGGILLVTLFSAPRISSREKIAAMIVISIPLISVIIATVQLVSDKGLFTIAVLTGGIIQGLILQWSITRVDRVLRDAMPYILISVTGWMGTMLATAIFSAVTSS
ncbi:MAG: hypothetical protein WCT28_03695 [Patescibacteria group bacterium]|jgi:hypothetical protein